MRTERESCSENSERAIVRIERESYSANRERAIVRTKKEIKREI